MERKPQSWLVKADPEVFGFPQMLAAPKRTTGWDGVRNYQARNHLRAMAVGDLVFVYHSNAKPPGVVGVAEVVREAYPDPTQFDPKHDHFDPRSKREAPSWDMVDLRALEPLPRLVSLEELKAHPQLGSLPVCQRASRLSVQPVPDAQSRTLLALAKRKSSL